MAVVWGSGVALAGLIADRIDVDYIIRDRTHASGVALILVSKKGENCIAVASGANSRLSWNDVKRAGKVIAKAAVFVTQLETPLATVSAMLVRCVLLRASSVPT